MILKIDNKNGTEKNFSRKNHGKKQLQINQRKHLMIVCWDFCIEG